MDSKKLNTLLEMFKDTDIRLKNFNEYFGEITTDFNKNYTFEVNRKSITINGTDFNIEDIVSIKPINMTLEERIEKIYECETLEIAMAYLNDNISSYEIEALETLKAKHHEIAIKNRIEQIKSKISKELAYKHSNLTAEKVLSHMLLNISKVAKIEQIKNLADLNEYTQKAICKSIKACEYDIF